VLDRAASDPQWKQQFLDDPEAATSEFPEAQMFEEMHESTMPEAISLPQEEYRQLQRSLWEKMLDKAEHDPQWRQQLLDDPEATMRAANFPEIERLAEMRQQTEEVRGQYWDDRTYLNWYGRWRTTRLAPWEVDVIQSGAHKIGGVNY
jgi:hypothetical protein